MAFSFKNCSMNSVHSWVVKVLSLMAVKKAVSERPKKDLETKMSLYLKCRCSKHRIGNAHCHIDIRFSRVTSI